MILKQESVGAFIGAVCAIAATIIAREIPGDLGPDFQARHVQLSTIKEDL